MKKPKTKKPGIVQKVIPPPVEHEPEKAQIAIQGADHLYREIRIDNILTDENGKEVKLKPGAPVEVTVEADPSVTVPKQAHGPETDDDKYNHSKQ